MYKNWIKELKRSKRPKRLDRLKLNTKDKSERIFKIDKDNQRHKEIYQV